MRGDWHRYNLKRRVTSLPPITAEVFSEKVLQAQATSTAAASKAAYERPCTICEKTYFSENAYLNHINSQKHKAKKATAGANNGELVDDGASSMMSSTFSLGDASATTATAAENSNRNVGKIVEGLKQTQISGESTAESDAKMSDNKGSENGDEDEYESRIPLSRCLFCNYDSPSLACNIVHMERIHGMFIPEKDFLVEQEGLIRHFQKKIHYFHECLFCGKMKPSVFGLQTHMRDIGHCKIPFESEAEQLDIGDFYDFTSTYSDVEQDDEDEAAPSKPKRNGLKLGARRNSLAKDEEMKDGDGWETDSSESSLDSADLTAVPLEQRTHMYERLNQHPHHAHHDPRPHHNKDGWHSHAHKHVHAAYYSEYELHLPSGRTAGHRSLNKYYRQNLHNHPSAQERAQQAIEAAEHSDSDTATDEERQVAHRPQRGRAMVSRANGGLGMVGVTNEKRKEVQAAEKRSRQVEERERRKFQWGNNKQSNSQKHFRDPLLQ